MPEIFKFSCEILKLSRIARMPCGCREESSQEFMEKWEQTQNFFSVSRNDLDFLQGALSWHSELGKCGSAWRQQWASWQKSEYEWIWISKVERFPENILEVFHRFCFAQCPHSTRFYPIEPRVVVVHVEFFYGRLLEELG